jgi:hypothetical protein
MKKRKAKREALLIDEMLALDAKLVHRDWQPSVTFIKERLRQAKVFKFDEQAAVYAARMMVAHPEAIAHDLDFCIPPYERMYIEFPYQKFWDITTPADYKTGAPLPDGEEDDTVGYLYDGPNVYVMSRVSRQRTKADHAMVLPIRYRLGRPFTLNEELALAAQLETSRIGLDSMFWGSCHRTLIERHDKKSLRALRDNHSFDFWYGNEMREFVSANVLRQSAGDLRNIVGFILFLNRTRDVQVVDELPPAPGFVHAKPRTLVRANLIRIKLDPGPMLQRVFKGRATGGWRREHDVRGHFCHDRNYHAAKHQHNVVEIDIHHWRCTLCGGRKWWRREHHRGRKDLGQVRTVYEVAQ